MVRGRTDHGLDLPYLHGENYKEAYHPLMSNVMTCKRNQQGYHCAICHQAVSKEFYEHLHLAYCIAIVTDMNDRGEAQLRTCGIRLAVESPRGCGNHTYAQGFNLIFKLAWKHQAFEMPNLLPHNLPGFVYPERASGMMKGMPKVRGMTGQLLLKSTKMDIAKSHTATKDIRGMDSGVDNVIPAPQHLGQEASAFPFNQIQQNALARFGLPQTISEDTEELLCRMAGIPIEAQQSKAKTVPVKAVIELTETEVQDPESWICFENKKRQQAQRLHRARLAQKEKVSKEKESVPARKKGQAKQAQSSKWKCVQKAKKCSYSVV
ncbi:hypothetical protein Ptr86124_010183 [Pyrenophora tritici-repentis]|uniref:Uncharacterized protein n=2 Tax=Pyrenophora tritici-repentis TaxID=45151 RepID=A0A922SXU5_9PLEO|nr:hypothetical protein Ptr86124_010183 [Pyrenophora tritici-repentis]